MNPPLVSVITAVRNDVTGIERTIRSVLEQTYPVIDYVVIDGGSTDGTREIVEKHAPGLAAWKSEPDRGIAEAFNKGIKLARGELLLFMNSGDTFASPDALAKAIGALPPGVDPRRAIFYGNALIVSDEGTRIQHCDHRQLLLACSICHQSTLVGSLIQHANLYDERLATQMDYDLWLRCLDRHPFFKIETILSNYQEGGITGSDRHGVRMRVEKAAVRWINAKDDLSIRSTVRLLRELLEFAAKASLRKSIGQRSFLRIKRLLGRGVIKE